MIEWDWTTRPIVTGMPIYLCIYIYIAINDPFGQCQAVLKRKRHLFMQQGLIRSLYSFRARLGADIRVRERWSSSISRSSWAKLLLAWGLAEEVEELSRKDDDENGMDDEISCTGVIADWAEKAPWDPVRPFLDEENKGALVEAAVAGSYSNLRKSSSVSKEEIKHEMIRNTWISAWFFPHTT